MCNPLLCYRVLVICLIPILTSSSLQSSNLNKTSSDSQNIIITPEISQENQVSGKLEVRFSIGGSEIVLDLQQNREYLLSTLVYSQREDGTSYKEHIIPKCKHYYGTVKGDKHSSVALTRCQGFRGAIVFDGMSYRIRALSESDTGKHELYEPPKYYGYTTTIVQSIKTRRKRVTEPKNTRLEILEINVKKLPKRLIELSVVVDRSHYKLLGSDKVKTTEYVHEVINHIAKKYRPYNIMVGLKQLKIWDKRDDVQIIANHTLLLDQFGLYRNRSLLKEKRSDASLLMTAFNFGDASIGVAELDAICDNVYSVSLNEDVKGGKDPLYFATIIAHELGHNLGLLHDSTEDGGCHCPCDKDDFGGDRWQIPAFCGKQDRCIMNPTLNDELDHFSICSRKVLEKADAKQDCLFDNLYQPDLVDGPTCGNGIVEKGEECDCGTDEECPILDPCCEVGTCKLKNTSSCYTGPCCKDCQFVKRNTVCREASDKQCDFPEYCSGKSSECPNNNYRQNGRSCSDDWSFEGFCYSGACQTHNRQCKLLFGDKAEVAPEACWNYNEQNFAAGNCGRIPNTKQYYKCAPENKKCGVLHCRLPNYDKDKDKEKIMKNLYDISAASPRFYPFQLNNPKEWCLTVEYEPKKSDTDKSAMGTEDFRNIGNVNEGTYCEANKYCLNKECTGVTYTMCPTPYGKECNGKGACNNKNQCFCELGWDPNTNCVDIDKEFPPENKDMMTIVITLVCLLIIVPIIVGIAVFWAKHRYDLKTMAKPRTIMRSLSRISRRLSHANRRSNSGSMRRMREPKTDKKTVTHNSRPVAPLETSSTICLTESCDHVASKPRNYSVAIKSWLNGARASFRGNPNRPNGKTYPTSPSAESLDVTKTVGNRLNGADPLRPLPPVVPSKPNSLPRPNVPPRPAKSTASTTPNSSPRSIDKSTLHNKGTPFGVNLRSPNSSDNESKGKYHERRHSETLRNVNIPLDGLRNTNTTCNTGSGTLSRTKKLQAPNSLIGKSRASKKLQISGPKGEVSSLIDGRPKSFISVTDIKSSDSSLNTVSSTRQLFEPHKSKPMSKFR